MRFPNSRLLAPVAALGALLCVLATQAQAAEVSVAVAANFIEPAKAIAAAFAAKTGDHALLSPGASGQFYTQISHGAPFEILLSADADRPERIEHEGLGVAGTRFTYAIGTLVLFSKTPGLVDPAGAVLAHGGFKSLAIADPGAAPYGQAAVETLNKLGLSAQLQPRLVKGASIGQAYQWVETGVADLGFVALSQVVDEPGGSRWIVPAADHAPIVQQAILLSPGAKDPAAQAFLDFLKSPQAVAIIRRYGYEVP